MNQTAFSTVIDHLREWQADVISHLRKTQGDAEALSRKLEIESAIRSLEFCAKHQITADMQVCRLPQVEDSFGEFRLLWDYETEDKAHWQEARSDGKPMRAVPGDLLLGRIRSAQA